MLKPYFTLTSTLKSIASFVNAVCTDMRLHITHYITANSATL